jgi:hypothetical protein
MRCTVLVKIVDQDRSSTYKVKSDKDRLTFVLIEVIVRFFNQALAKLLTAA